MEIALSYSADPAPGHQAAEKQVACEEEGSYVLACMKEHTLMTKLSSQLLSKLVSLLEFE